MADSSHSTSGGVFSSMQLRWHPSGPVHLAARKGPPADHFFTGTSGLGSATNPFRFGIVIFGTDD
jgi:hypothetical protein